MEKHRNLARLLIGKEPKDTVSLPNRERTIRLCLQDRGPKISDRWKQHEINAKNSHKKSKVLFL